MKKLFVVVPLFIVLFSSCFKEGLRGTGAIQSETRNLNGTFNEVRIKGSMDLKVIQGDSIKVVARDYQNLLPYLETRIEGHTLVIDYEDALWVLHSAGEVTVTVPQLVDIEVDGSGDVSTVGNFDFNDIQLNINGSGDFTMSGSAKNLTTKIVGSGDIKAFNLLAKKTTASITGSGDIQVNVEQTLDATISGSGDIIYKGSPTVNTHISGSGSVRRY